MLFIDWSTMNLQKKIKKSKNQNIMFRFLKLLSTPNFNLSRKYLIKKERKDNNNISKLFAATQHK
jgi:hypothetical protein